MLLLEWSHKNLGFATSHLFFLICIDFRFAKELASKLRLISGYSNFNSQPILHLSSHSMYRREHSALLQLSTCVPPRKTTIAASKSLPSVASNIWNSLPNHLPFIPALPAFRRALKHHLVLLAYPDSGAKSGKIKPAQSITLRDTPPTILPSHSPEIPCRPSKGAYD